MLTEITPVSANFPVVDFHIHFPVEGLDKQITSFYDRYQEKYGARKRSVLEEWSKYYRKQWLLQWGFPDPAPPPGPGEGARLWLEEARRWGVSRLVFVTGGGNRSLSQIIEQGEGVFSGFAHHPPESPGSAEELERCVKKLNFKGYKLFAPLVETPLCDPSLELLWETAEKFQLPVLVHFGILGGGGGIASGTNISPLSLEPVARAYPGIPFVVPHFGCGYLRELLQLCWSCANVYVDTSGNNEWLRWYPYPLTVRDLFHKFRETVGAQRIIFGTDSSWFPRGWAAAYFAEQFQACTALGFNQGEMSLVFGGTAERLLNGVKHHA